MTLEVSGLADLTQITATTADELTVTVTVSSICPIGTYNLAVKTVRCRNCASDGDTVILTENITLNVVSASASATATASNTSSDSNTASGTAATTSNDSTSKI